MRERAALGEDAILRFGTGLVAAILLLAALLAAGLARDHMAALGSICGASSYPHCGWCYGAAGLFTAGLAAFAVALRPTPAAARAR